MNMVGYIILTIIIFYLILGLTIYKGSKAPPDKINIEKKKRDYLITINGNQYRGECTVWNHYPNGYRCSTSLESRLHNIWQKEVWREEDDR